MRSWGAKTLSVAKSSIECEVFGLVDFTTASGLVGIAAVSDYCVLLILLPQMLDDRLGGHAWASLLTVG